MLYNIYNYMYLLLTLRIYLDLSGKSKSKRQICWIANGSVDQLQPLRLCGPFPPERAHDGPEQWTPTACSRKIRKIFRGVGK